MAAPDDEFFASGERNFFGIGCTMEAQTTVSNSTQGGFFIGEYKKYTVSGVTFSFKHEHTFTEISTKLENRSSRPTLNEKTASAPMHME